MVGTSPGRRRRPGMEGFSQGDSGGGRVGSGAEDSAGVLERFRQRPGPTPDPLGAQARGAGEGGPAPAPLHSWDPERMEDEDRWVGPWPGAYSPLSPHSAGSGISPGGESLSAPGHAMPRIGSSWRSARTTTPLHPWPPIVVHGRVLLEAMARSYLFRRPPGRVGLNLRRRLRGEFIGPSRTGRRAWR